MFLLECLYLSLSRLSLVAKHDSKVDVKLHKQTQLKKYLYIYIGLKKQCLTIMKFLDKSTVSISSKVPRKHV